jgi:hypothetical protein
MQFFLACDGGLATVHLNATSLALAREHIGVSAIGEKIDWGKR